MARRKAKLPPPAGRVYGLQRVALESRSLVTIRHGHPVWDGRTYPDDIAKSLVRLEPPAHATAADIEMVREDLMGNSGACAVKVMPRVAAQQAQGPATAPVAPTDTQSHRERVMARAGALVGCRDLPALEAVLSEALDSAGL